MREREKRRRSYQITVIALMGIIVALLVALIFMISSDVMENKPVSASSSSDVISSSSMPAPPVESSSSSEPISSSSEAPPPPVSSSSVAPPPPPPPAPPAPPVYVPPAPVKPLVPAVPEVTNLSISQTGTYDENGTYENITISSNNVILKNKTITGDLFITNEVGKKGVIRLENVIVEGEMYIYNGSDVDGIILKDCSINKMTVQNSTNTIGIIAEGKTEVAIVSLRSHAYFDESDVHYKYFGFRKIVVFEGPQVWYIAEFGNVYLDELIIHSPLKLHTNSDTYIKEVQANNSFKVTGKGTIDTLRVKSDHITYETKPKDIRNPSGNYEDPYYEGR